MIKKFSVCGNCEFKNKKWPLSDSICPVCGFVLKTGFYYQDIMNLLNEFKRPIFTGEGREKQMEKFNWNSALERIEQMIS